MSNSLENERCSLAAFNRTDEPFPDHVTLHQLIEEQVRQHPGERAVVGEPDGFFGDASLTYAELNERSNQLAHFLRSQGAKPGQLVGVLMERSFAMIVSIFGILKAGSGYLPLSPDDPADRLRYILSDASVEMLLVHGATLPKAPAGFRVINLEQPELFRGPTDNPGLVNKPGDLAYVIYTSGSTGKPKGVMIEHRSVVNRLHWMQAAYPIGREDVILQKTSYCFDVSVWELFWWALAGATLCLLMPRGERIPQAIVETVRKHRVTVMHFVPSMLNVFLEYLEDKPAKVSAALPSLRRVFASGEALSPNLVRKFNKVVGASVGARLTNLYGPTEATVDVTYFDCPAEGEIQKVPIGRPIQNIRAYIVKDGELLPMGEVGELCLAGVGLARGYLNNPHLTKERFVEMPALPGERIYRTGDLARWLPDGNLEYLGREDHQVKIRGLRIELGEIENTILVYPGIADCVVTAKWYSESITLIIGYLVCKRAIDLPELKQHLLRYLPDYMVPSHFEILDRIPLGPHGKVDRAALPEPALGAKHS